MERKREKVLIEACIKALRSIKQKYELPGEVYDSLTGMEKALIGIAVECYHLKPVSVPEEPVYSGFEDAYEEVKNESYDKEWNIRDIRQLIELGDLGVSWTDISEILNYPESVCRAQYKIQKAS